MHPWLTGPAICRSLRSAVGSHTLPFQPILLKLARPGGSLELARTTTWARANADGKDWVCSGHTSKPQSTGGWAVGCTEEGCEPQPDSLEHTHGRLRTDCSGTGDTGAPSKN